MSLVACVPPSSASLCSMRSSAMSATPARMRSAKSVSELRSHRACRLAIDRPRHDAGGVDHRRRAPARFRRNRVLQGRRFISGAPCRTGIGPGGAGLTWPNTEPMHDAPRRPSTCLLPSCANYFPAIISSHLASCSGCDKMRSGSAWNGLSFPTETRLATRSPPTGPNSSPRPADRTRAVGLGTW